jgi:hypothetical protein
MGRTGNTDQSAKHRSQQTLGRLLFVEKSQAPTIIVALVPAINQLHGALSFIIPVQEMLNTHDFVVIHVGSAFARWQHWWCAALAPPQKSLRPRASHTLVVLTNS